MLTDMSTLYCWGLKMLMSQHAFYENTSLLLSLSMQKLPKAGNAYSCAEDNGTT